MTRFEKVLDLIIHVPLMILWILFWAAFIGIWWTIAKIVIFIYKLFR